ncbi:hypothetical protein FRC0414_02333 [Corynebacterium diphtheriae]|nr:hypothetical protein FRC0414_02333 [Corynebacterium diphtheriae]
MKRFLPSCFSSVVMVLNLRSHTSTPAASAAWATAVSSAYLRIERPSTSLNPGQVLPWFTASDSACASTSAAHAFRSGSWASTCAISASVSSAGGANSCWASARFASARVRQVGESLQNRQHSPGANSPSPRAASTARGFTTCSAHASSSATEIVQVETFERLGWKIVNATSVMSYSDPNAFNAPSAYNMSCGLCSASTMTPWPYFKSMI